MTHERVDFPIRRLRPGQTRLARGPVHPGQRPLRHPRCGGGGRGRGGALPRDLPGGMLQPPGDHGRRPRGGQRGPRQPAQLALPELPRGRRPVVRPRRRRDPRIPAGDRPLERAAHAPHPLSRPGRPHQLHPQPQARAHAPTAPGGVALDPAGGRLVRKRDREVGPGRRGHQRRRRALPPAQLQAPGDPRQGARRRGRRLPGGPDQPIAHASGSGGAHAPLPRR